MTPVMLPPRYQHCSYISICMVLWLHRNSTPHFKFRPRWPMVRRKWGHNQNSEDEKGCRNHSEVTTTIGSILVLSLKRFNKHVQGMPSLKFTAWRTPSVQSCRIHNEENCWKNYEYHQHRSTYSHKSRIFLCRAFHFCIVIQEALSTSRTVETNFEGLQQCERYKQDLGKWEVLWKHWLLMLLGPNSSWSEQNVCGMASITKQLVWSCCHGVLCMHKLISD